MRGIFFEEREARAAASTLAAEGYAVQVVRERLAGEDDDEGHPWAVLTDAPQPSLELLVDRYDGWLDLDGPDGAGVPSAPDLPAGPRRARDVGGGL